MGSWRRGLLMVFTGDGKGKTTAAMGSALRAIGHGMKVLMIQFIKGTWHYGELDAARLLGGALEIRPMGRGFLKPGQSTPDPQHIEAARQALAAARSAIESRGYDMVILDEINNAVDYGLLDIAEVLETLRLRPPEMHVICTGRNAHPRLIEEADLVSEVRAVKHPFDKGIRAQRGIEY
ncbi:MAG: cob(I)yrinic acid a,c-diamide adenosyltransferase [Bryobacterales bacterium]|nr:cob(I)yrinic acid a,c-diamide adenosyltransferase [Bryobacteraceae bacterium]MDW8129091.1 cob(I)yrinic acid a,c-diamide adenosyltransferase [Bryobacterales bacterium]